uniref:Uncharacterized protein n=1 Tax=Oryza nivara TaxID=4536 RepID=A0A0E0GE09_ORYNI
MKANNVFQVTLLLSYLLLTIGGKELKSINSREKANESLTSPQVNITIQGAGIEYWDEVYGIWGSIYVYDPKVKKDSQDLTASWIQINNLPKAAVGVGIGVGSCVSPSLSGDNFARFHIFWVRHMMGQKESMMDHDNEELKKGCVDHNCPGFVQVSRNVGLGGRIHPISIYNGPQYVINVLIFKDPKTENWWLAYGSNNTPIGYWPSSQFSYLKAKGDYAFWGGYVQGPIAASDPPQMGSGHFASEGFGKTTFIRNIQVIEDKNNKLVTPNIHDSDPFSSDPKLYSYDGYGLNDNRTHMEPSSFPIGMDIKSPLVGAISQAQLSTIDCPIGTIPIVRNNNLANMMVQRIGTLANDDLPMLGAGIEYWDEIYGMQASINVYEPSVKKDSKDVSASWIQISVVPKGTNGIGIGAGSCVYPRSGDSFARFHIRWDNEELNKSCSDHNCPGFMQVSHSVGLGGRINPISVYNGPQYVINVLIFKVPCLSMNIQVIEDKDNKLVTPNIRNANPFSNNLKLYSYDGYGLNDDGGVKIHIDRDGIIGSTIPSKDLNMTIQMEPSSYPLDLDIQSILSSNISESNFPDIKCPTGTIPILRHNSSEAHMPNGGSQEEYAGIKYWDDNSFYGTHATLSVNQPFLTRNNGDHIASFVQLNNGPEEIAAGSIVWPSFSGDNFVRFHIRWDRKTKDWWLERLDKSSAIGYRPLGYWPSKLFDTLQEKATYAFWGGWVRGPTVSLDPPPMGSGHFAKEGYRKAALVKGIRIANKDNNFVNPNVGKATTVTTRGLCYTVDGFGVLKMACGWQSIDPLSHPLRSQSLFSLSAHAQIPANSGTPLAAARPFLHSLLLLHQPIMSSLCPFAKLASAGATCPVKSDNKTTSCPVTANNHTDDDDNEKTGNANTDPRVVPAKCPFGYDSNNTFKLGPLSCVVCHALLHQSSKCTPCSHKFCKACILRFKDCPLCGADIQGIEPDDELQGLVDRFIDGHARIKRSHAAGDGEAASDKTKVIYEDVSMERGAFLVQQAMRAFRAQNIESAKSRLSMCAEDIREELKSKEDNQELCSQLGAVLGMLGDCCRTLGDAPSAITYYEESAEFLSKLPKKDLEVLVHTLSVSLNKIGDLCYYDGDLHSARSYYARSLDVRRSAVKEHSAVASQVIDVATSLAKVADVDRNLGNESMAVEGFEEAIKCLENLKLESGEASLEQRRLSVLDFLQKQLDDK